MGSLTANLKQSSLTLYEQLANKILNDINHEKYLPGAQIPTELELQRSTGYSRSTVRHALRILVNKGVLVKIHGKGTFVQDGTSNETTRSQFFSLTNNVENLGASISTKLVDIQPTRASKEQAEFFGIEPKTPLLKLTRLRYVDKSPFCVEYIYFTEEFSSITSENLNGSLYQVLHDQFNEVPAGGHKMFDITKASTSEAFLLNVERDTSLMQITDFVYDQNDHPLHITIQVIRSDKYKYELIQ